MKRWFYSLEKSSRVKYVVGEWIFASALLVLVGVLPRESSLSFLVSALSIGAIAVSIIFTVWNAGATKKQVLAEKAEALRQKKIQQAAIRMQREELLRQKVAVAQNELNSLPYYVIDICKEPRSRKTEREVIAFSNITSKGNYSEFVVFDTETTWLSPTRDRIVELAAVRFVNGIPTEVFNTFINPQMEIPEQATAINHITNEMVANAPTISEVLPSFEAFVGNSSLIAHNLGFDIEFLVCSGCKITDSPRKYYDTLQQAQMMLRKVKRKYNRENGAWEADYDSDWDVPDHKLGTLAEYFDIAFPCQHRAAGDAIVTGKLFLELVKKKQSLL